ncbi:MAG: hypothetical protein H7X93_02705 [Sphingomonadaceae bacterium]|nr:hypothetical protein [Sphingomonadaceae bacterium]
MRSRSISAALAFLASLISLEARAVAQPPVVFTSAEWQHRLSGIAVPHSVEGIARGEWEDSSGRGLNVIIQYGSPQDASWATLYIYRSAVANPSIWFESARRALEANPNLGIDPGAAPEVSFFDSNGNETADTGLFVVSGAGDLRSTGLALTEINGWLIKVRLSSRTLDPTANRAALLSILASLTLPQRTGAERRVSAISQCAEPLPTRHARAETVSTMQAMIEAPAFPPTPPSLDQTYCGNELPIPVLRTYRAIDGSPGYLMTLADSGRFAHVRLSPPDNDNERYRVDVFDVGVAHIAGYFMGLPSPDQVTPLAMNALQGRSLGVVTQSLPASAP